LASTDIPSGYVVLVRLKTKEGEAESFKGELQPLLATIREEEPACIRIMGHQDPDDPSRFMLYEVWRTEEEFWEFESGRDYMRAYLDRVGELWAEPRDLTTWREVA